MCKECRKTRNMKKKIIPCFFVFCLVLQERSVTRMISFTNRTQSVLKKRRKGKDLQKLVNCGHFLHHDLKDHKQIHPQLYGNCRLIEMIVVGYHQIVNFGHIDAQIHLQQNENQSTF